MVFQLTVTRWRLLSRVNRSIKGIAHVPVHACVCACVWKVLTYDRYSSLSETTLDTTKGDRGGQEDDMTQKHHGIL